jgi:hypothetical protein
MVASEETVNLPVLEKHIFRDMHLAMQHIPETVMNNG